MFKYSTTSPCNGFSSDFPENLELVIFKHKNYFYRGRVEGVDSQGVMITFIDYGYMTIVDPDSVYEWHPRWNTIPGN